MKINTKLIAPILVWALLLSSFNLRAESIDDKFTEISPSFKPGGGEFLHGTGYGKLMMRVIIFGAVGSQGVHYMPEGTDLMFAIIYTGGKIETAKLNGITIRRRTEKDLLKVNLEDLIADGQPVPKLIDGDIISVPYNWRYDYQEFLFISGIFTSVTALILSIVALTRE